ncbi:uncharacterized protein [Engystomops pustulosus]|uniref:uncharacterized protein n=1 Tax=Engystomops pustulosus TaxID=76066 RepID=UPI003AFB2030
MEEWEYVEGHKDLYKEVMMEDHQPLTSPGKRRPSLIVEESQRDSPIICSSHVDNVSVTVLCPIDGSSRRDPPERCPRPPDSQDWPGIKQEVPPDHQENWGGITQGLENPTSVSVHGEDRMKDSHEDLLLSPYYKEEDNITQDNRISPNVPSFPHGKDPSTDTSGDQEPSTSRSLIGNISTGQCQEEMFLGAKPLETKLDLSLNEMISSDETSNSEHDSGESFNQKSSLDEHKRNHTGEKPFSCSECGKNFTKKSNLIKHQITHTGEKPFSCTECDKRFSQKGSLVKHLRIHTGEKPFLCTECGKTFSQKYHLRDHQRVHIGYKPFSCSECGLLVNKKSDLKRHLRTHTGEKPFSCSECGLLVMKKSDLIRHLRTHTGEKPFSCTECGKQYAQKSSLTKHQKIHLGDKPFPCLECGQSFDDRFVLFKHQITHGEMVAILS